MNFILTEFNKEKITAIDNYIKRVYNTNSMIYGSNNFCNTMANSFLPMPEYNKRTTTDICTGYIGVYYGIEVYCVPELQDATGMVIPKFKEIQGVNL